MMTVEVKN